MAISLEHMMNIVKSQIEDLTGTKESIEKQIDELKDLLRRKDEHFRQRAFDFPEHESED